MLTYGLPFNFREWIAEHRDVLKPPVGNAQIWEDADFIVTVVGGPNQRSDYHVDPLEEFFYQLEGDITVKIQEDGQAVDVPIREGEIFLLPPRVPHSPQRMAGSIGLVIERKRLAHEDDALMWFCVDCNHKLYEERFHLVDIEQDFFRVFERFYRDDTLRTCPQCGTLNPRPSRYEMQADSQADIT